MTRRQLLAQAARGFPAIIVPKLIMAAPKGKGPGRVKPTTGVQLIGVGGAPNVMAFLFNEGAGPYAFDALKKYRLILDRNAGGDDGFFWSGGSYGTCLQSRTSDFGRMLLVNTDVLSSSSTVLGLPTAAISIAYGYQKTDTTNRAASVFLCGGSLATQSLGTHAPYSDGVLYWDFSTSRLSKSGLTFGDDIFVYTAGPRGMTIWQNAVKVASTATAAAARINDTTAFDFNGAGTLDLFKLHFFYMWDYELTDNQAISVSLQPFQFFRQGSAALQYFNGGSAVKRKGQTIIV